MNQCIVVFGGTGGIGEAIVRRLSSRWPVVIGYSTNRDKANNMVDELVAAGCSATAMQVDVCDAGSVSRFLQYADNSHQGVRGVISAGGPTFSMGLIADANEQDFRETLETDVIGNFNILKTSIPLLTQFNGGSIVLFLTTAILRTIPFDGLSSIPKAAVAMMLRQAAREAGPQNIRVNGIAPGAIDTDLGLRLMNESPPAVKAVLTELIEHHTPLSRLGTPMEVASLAEFLVSDDASYINGQIIAVDGGFSS